ncbi:MAG: efflux RND transporter periplasmic adaptor subunit [Gammaproteobacteria bacterium]|nr:efflux RND transporter periplasmic adaptor subunit [Gammaproteobacteria bacterium]
MGKKGSRDEVGTGAPGSENVPVAARLCYVDDSRTSAYVVRRLLKPFGYQVDHFSSAEPAFVALVQEDYDLLLTDLKVSPTGMDGDDLIRTLRQSGHPKISIMPIIVITGATDAEVLVNVYDAGANQVMKKPVNADELDAHIRRLLFDGRQSETTSLQTKSKKMERGLDDGKVVTLHAIQRPLRKPELPIAPQLASPSSSEASVEKTDIPVLSSMPPVVESADPVLSATETTKAPSILRAMEQKSDATTAGNKTTDVEQPDSVIVGEPEKTKEVPMVKPASHENQNTRNAKQADDDNILSEIGQYPLLDSERTGLFARSKRMRGLLLSVLSVAVMVAAALMVWDIYFKPAQPVDTVSVEFGEIFQSVTVPGRVVSKQRVNVSPARAGRLVEVWVKEGEKVKQGQVLAKIDDRELISRLNRVKISLSSAQENIVVAERTLDRLRKAHAKGAVARHLVEDAEADLLTARSKADIAAEEVRSATLELDSQRITAAFGGTVTARHAEIGQWVDPTETLFTLMDDTQREIEAHVDAADSVAVNVGQVVMVSSDAFPGLEWQESVVRLGAEAGSQQNANSIKVYVSLGSDSPMLQYGQQVNADIRTEWNPNTLKIPFAALSHHNGQTVVAVLEGEHARMRIIETGIEDFSMAEVKQGLSEGETVILLRGTTLKNGDKVYPRTLSK